MHQIEPPSSRRFEETLEQLDHLLGLCLGSEHVGGAGSKRLPPYLPVGLGHDDRLYLGMEVLECPAQLQGRTQITVGADGDDVGLELHELLDGAMWFLDRQVVLPAVNGALESGLHRPAESLLEGNGAVGQDDLAAHWAARSSTVRISRYTRFLVWT